MSFAASDERLAAILAIDVAGFSRMMAVDQSGTHARLVQLFDQVMDPQVRAHRGRVFKRTGDGLLAEFPSAGAAVRSALGIQEEAERRAAEAPDASRLRLRAGVALGDVIADGDDLYGDGVNQAARLEGVAGLGEVFVSESAARAGADSAVEFTDLGQKQLKNLPHPVRVFRAGPAREAALLLPTTAAIPGFGHRPAIAVMPFEVAEPGDRLFADGLAEDLISAIARWRSFPVMSRGASFALRGRGMSPGEIGRALGSRYVHEGGVARGPDRLVVRADLVDAQTGESLLSERFEGAADDALRLLVELAERIVGRLEPELVRREAERARQVPLPHANTYELYQRALWHHYRYNEADNATARALFGKSLALEPDYARAAAGLALATGQAAWCSWVEEGPAYAEALALARRAVQIDPADPANQFALGILLSQLGRAAEALERLRECVRLNPSHAAGLAIAAACHNYLDEPEKAVPLVELALRLSPHDPRRLLWMPVLAGAHYLLGNYLQSLRVSQDALLSVAQDVAGVDPSYLATARWLVASMGQLGRRAEAASALPLLRKLDPDLAASERRWARRMFTPATAERLLDGLRKAGFR